MSHSHTFYEFFAGGGLARVGLGDEWTCLFANDISIKKANTYKTNFEPASELRVGDIRQIDANDVPGAATLAWASFPCQDLSLAGQGGGLKADRSGIFWSFWSLMTSMAQQERKTPIIVLENVTGLLSATKGKDFQELLTVLVASGYRPGAVIIDAVHFVPQSRPRLFIVAVQNDYPIPAELFDVEPKPNLWRPASLLSAYHKLPKSIQNSWIWWNLPDPPSRKIQLIDCIEETSKKNIWHTSEETAYILSLMSDVNMAKVRKAQSSGVVTIGTVYKRVRVEDTLKKQRAEIRFDGISGCLRTPTGGSSRQIIMIIEGESIRSRLLSVREAARLMGLDDTYRIPDKYNDGYHVMGDGVVVPVVAWLEKNILNPLATSIAMTVLADATY